MKKQNKAAQELRRFFTREKIPYAIIGGIAVQFWGEPRFTQDVDVTILVPLEEEEGIIEKILSVFPARISKVNEFILKTRVLPLRSREDCPIDISLGVPGYEEEVMKRAVKCILGKGPPVSICSAEDLIIHKAVAGRPQDLSDIEGVILRQGKKLDIKYIRYWLRQFALLLEKDEILKHFEKPWKNHSK